MWFQRFLCWWLGHVYRFPYHADDDRLTCGRCGYEFILPGGRK